MSKLKHLASLTSSDFFNGRATEGIYRGIKFIYSNGYINLFYKNKNINSFMCASNKISDIKNAIMERIKKHDILSLMRTDFNTLENKYGFKKSDIMLIQDYSRLTLDIVHTTKQFKQKALSTMLFIKEYFIFYLSNN